MTDISKGDWVMCIRSDRAADLSVQEGGVYYVQALKTLRAPEGWEAFPGCWTCNCCGRNEDVALDLAGRPLPEWLGWCVCCFKPLKRGPGSAVEATGGVSIPAGVRALDEALAGYSDGLRANLWAIGRRVRCPTTPAA